MASDFDAHDDDDYNDFDGDGLRWMSIMVVLLVIFGFFSLAWYAYQMSSEQMGDEEVVLIKADESELREAPEDPGGMNIPHQDKTVYETVTAMDSDDTPNITSPSEEEPLVTRELGGASEWIKGRGEPTSSEAKLEVLEKAVASVEKDEIDAIAQKEERDMSAFIKRKEEELAPVIEEMAPIPAPIAKIENPIVEKVEPKPTPKPKVVAKPKPAPKKKAPAASARYRVQLAALKSQAEANKTWSRMSKKSLLKGKSHVINKVKVKGATYYRLRVGSYQTRSSAAAFCNKLKAANISCLVN